MSRRRRWRCGRRRPPADCDSDLQTGLDARPQNERIEPEVLAAAAPQRIDDVRHDRAEGDLLDAARVGAVLPENAAQEQAELVRRSGRTRRLAETQGQCAVVKDAAEDLAVADVERENHDRSPRDTLSVSRAAPGLTAPSRRHHDPRRSPRRSRWRAGRGRRCRRSSAAAKRERTVSEWSPRSSSLSARSGPKARARAGPVRANCVTPQVWVARM